MRERGEGEFGRRLGHSLLFRGAIEEWNWAEASLTLSLNCFPPRMEDVNSNEWIYLIMRCWAMNSGLLSCRGNESVSRLNHILNCQQGSEGGNAKTTADHHLRNQPASFNRCVGRQDSRGLNLRWLNKGWL